MAEDKYTRLREVLNDIAAGCGFLFELEPHWQLIRDLLSECDALKEALEKIALYPTIGTLATRIRSMQQIARIAKEALK